MSGDFTLCACLEKQSGHEESLYRRYPSPSECTSFPRSTYSRYIPMLILIFSHTCHTHHLVWLQVWHVSY